jgi:hypothetical protein
MSRVFLPSSGMALSFVAWPSIAVALCLPFASGCGSTSRIAPVSGVVTLDGKPLANAHVAFQPQSTGKTSAAGVGSYAVTDSSGVYQLKMSDTDQPGAIIGPHRVEVNLKVEADDRDPRTRPAPKVLPTKYNRDTELTFEVPPGGTDKANFDLVSSK